MTKKTTWVGSSVEIDYLASADVKIQVLPLYLVLTIEDIDEFTSITTQEYRYTKSGFYYGIPYSKDDINYETTYLIGGDGKDFYTEDDTGNGTQRWTFSKNKCGKDELTFSYCITGAANPINAEDPSILNQNAKFILHKSDQLF